MNAQTQLFLNTSFFSVVHFYFKTWVYIVFGNMHNKSLSNKRKRFVGSFNSHLNSKKKMMEIRERGCT